ncbi:MAG: OmpA family protein [Parachlamydiaceae bacterium]|nr:OmpA family protein [Parachlamydiaceae bacterium]
MRTRNFLFYFAAIGIICTLQSCARTGGDVWDDTKSAGRHVGRGVGALGGKNGDSRQVRSKSDFESIDDNFENEQGGGFQDVDYPDTGYQATDYVPLQDQCNEASMAEMQSQQPRETPGEAGSSIPGIEAFRDPSTIPELAGTFRTIFFDYDSSLVKGQVNLQTIHNIAEYMRRNPNTYVFVEGHTDERGPQAYNLALGSRRGNGVRNMLISEGVNPDNVFSVSYGKERPVIMERHEEGWAKNRRVDFKVYVR